MGMGRGNISKMLLDLRSEDEELWDIFACKDEYHPFILDRFGRFPSYMKSYLDPFDPKVSSKLIAAGFEPDFPRDHEFSVCLTHDVDFLGLHPIRHLINSGRSVKNGRAKDALEDLLSAPNRLRGAYHNLKGIMDMEEEYSARSTFFFLDLEKGDREYTYSLEDQAEDLGIILDRGGEIALHGGHETYQSEEEMKRMKDRLEKTVGAQITGFRNHFLKFEVPDTWRRLRNAGFEYDATLGFADRVGFRNGMCHPFFPYDLDSNEWIDVLEIPLAVMDCTLFDYMRLDMEGAWKMMKMLIDNTMKSKGVINILWHNTYFTGPYKEFYRKILEYAHENNAWLTNCQGINEWWRRD